MSVRERHRRERQARSEAILAAALAVFAEHGLEHSTIEMIAREAEVAVGTIYLYFSSRDDLYLNLMAERAEQLRARYLEIQSRGLPPVEELHKIAGAYLDYITASREMFLSQQSVAWSKLHKRIKRAAEIRNFKRVMDLSHEIFALWERTVKRVIDAGLIAKEMSPAKAAAVVWASINGAFMLMGNDNFFRDVTGLNPEHFIEEALESHLVAGEAANGAGKSRSNGGAGNGHAEKIKASGSQEVAARP